MNGTELVKLINVHVERSDECGREIHIRQLLAPICILVLCGILVAGLWPFHSPKNQVSWLPNGGGVLFGDYGSLLSASAFTPKGTTGGICFEIWLRPAVIDGWGTIFSFYPDEHSSTFLALRQSWDDVALLRRHLGEKRKVRTSKLYADNVFRPGEPVFLTISSGELGTSIYVNGVVAKVSRDFRFSEQDLTGKLVIGNAPATTDTWSGQVKGFAIYDRELTADQVAGRYREWMGTESRGVTTHDSAIALYRFNEGSGGIVHNYVDSATDLLIPQRFFVLHQPFLERPWNEYYPGWRYWKDIGVNIAGFIPFGFFFYAYLALVRRTGHPVIATVLLGFAVSLTIEVLQAFLPTRNSGMTDLITNTFGTALGVILCNWGPMQSFLWARVFHRQAF